MRRFIPLVLAALIVVPVALVLQAQSTSARMSAADISSARGAPITQGGKEVASSNWGTTPGAIWSADVAAANKTRTDFVQNIRIVNTHASQRLCIFDVAWSGSTACSSLCAAASRTCSGASTDGAVVLSGAAYAESWDGTACLCAVASAAATTAVAERVMRFPGG